MSSLEIYKCIQGYLKINNQVLSKYRILKNWVIQINRSNQIGIVLKCIKKSNNRIYQ